MGTRYAVMQEPSKGDKINEGIMKEITGGDPIQGRALFKDTVTFIPQFKLAVCTNTLFDIKSNDEGTWRRIRVCDFKSKFTEDPVDTDPHEPYQFAVDKNIGVKFEEWKHVFLSMLVEISYKNMGNVPECDMVMASMKEYRDGQDYLSEFVKEKVEKEEDGVIKKKELSEEFKKWYQIQYNRHPPPGKELYEYMNKHYGKPESGYYRGVKIIYDDLEEIEDLDKSY